MEKESDEDSHSKGECVVYGISAKPIKLSVMFLNRWTHWLVSMQTITIMKHKKFPEDYFLYISLTDFCDKQEEWQGGEMSKCKGLLFVNNNDSFTVADDFESTLKKWHKVPMCILKKGDGAQLLELYRRSHDDDVDKILFTQIQGLPGTIKKMSSLGSFFNLGKMKGHSDGSCVLDTSDIMIFKYTLLDMKKNYPVYHITDSKREKEPHYCMVQCTSESKKLCHLLTEILNHEYYRKDYLKAVIIIVNLEDGYPDLFFDELHGIYSNVTVVLAFVRSQCAKIDSAEIHPSMKDAVVMDCSSNCESLKTVSAAKLWLAVKKHADTTQEGHLTYSSEFIALDPDLKCLLQDTCIDHLPMYMIAMKHFTDVTEMKRGELYQAACSENIFTLTENLLFALESFKQDKELLSQIAAGAKQCFEQASDAPEHFFWRTLFLFFTEKPKPKFFWAEMHARKVNPICLSDPKLISQLKNWICLHSWLQLKPFTGKKLMKIIKTKGKDCTYVHAREFLQEMWEQVFRDDESSVVAMFDMLKKKKDVKLGSPLEGLQLASSVLSWTRSYYITQTVRGFCSQLAEVIEFQEVKTATTFYKECKDLFSKHYEDIFKAIKESMARSLHKLMGSRIMLEEVTVMTKLVKDDIGSIIDVQALVTYVNNLCEKKSSKSIYMEHFILHFKLSQSILDRYPNEQSIQIAVCKLVKQIVDDTPEEQANHILQYLANISFPHLGRGVGPAIDDVGTAIRSLWSKAAVQMDVDEVFLCVLESASAKEQSDLSNFEKCRLKAFSPLKHPMSEKCLTGVIASLQEAISSPSESGKDVCKICWDIIARECKEYNVESPTIQELCKREILELAVLFSSVDGTNMEIKCLEWRKKLQHEVQALKMDLVHCNITLKTVKELLPLWDDFKKLADHLNVPLEDTEPPAQLHRRMASDCLQLGKLLFLSGGNQNKFTYIKQIFQWTNITPPSSLGKLESILSDPVASIGGPMSLYAEFKELTTISEMSCSIKEVSCDLEPLKQHTEFLGYFNSKKKCTCLLLNFFVTQNTLLESKSVKALSYALEEMQNFIDELSQRGVPAMHPQLCSIGLTAENLKQEVAVWQGWCNSLATNLPDVISSYLTMRDSYLQISNFYDACQAYHLQACLEASEMKKMMKIHVRWCNAVHEFTNDQVLQDVQQMEDFFGCSPLMLPYLNVVYCSQQFHEFLKDLSRTNPSSFRDLYGIIEQRLPHDAKNELILASLLEAQESMSPFLDREQSFSTVILKVREVHTKYQSLKVVNEHIEKIKQWFRDAEGHTLESVVKEFEVIMKSAVFIVEEGKGNARRELMLQTGMQEKPWGESDINDFSRRLGLLEKTEKGHWDFPINLKDSVKLYRESLRVSRKLITIINQMEELGNTAKLGEILKCCESECNAEEARKQCQDKVEQCKDKMTKWKQEISAVRKEYNHLLLFMIPKLKLMEDIIAKEGSTKKIGRELVHLSASSQPVTRPLPNNGLPFENVGEYLKSTKFLDLQSRSPSEDHEHTHFLHVLADELGHRGLLLKLFEIHEKIPSPLLVYQCRRDTTEEEILIFYQRAKYFTGNFTVIDMNILPIRIQEAIVHAHQKCDNTTTLHYITFGPSKMSDVAGVTLTRNSLLSSSYASTKWQELVKECQMELNQKYSLQLIYGHAGSGKSEYIKRELEKTGLPYVVIAVDESFSVDRAIQKLRTLDNYEEQNAIYFNFTMVFPTDAVGEVENRKYQIMLEKLQWFFTNLLFLTYIEDFHTGLSFAFPQKTKWPVFIEVPSLRRGSSDDPQTYLDVLKEHIPVLKLVGEPRLIDHTSAFDIFTEDVQLVCKYLKAYDLREDCVVGIDKNYRGHLDEKVQFSRMPNISERECQRLLYRYTPENAKQNKMTWWNFIRFLVRKCRLMEICPRFTEKTVKEPYGSILLRYFLQEADQLANENATKCKVKDLSQLVHIMEEDTIVFHYLPAEPENMSPSLCRQFEDIHIKVQGIEKAEDRTYLEQVLASVFEINLEASISEEGHETNCLPLLDDRDYILTLDFALKMIQINERVHAGCPVIIEGETGVGKTFLIEMVAGFWNLHVMRRWKRVQNRLKKKVDKLCSKNSQMRANTRSQEDSFFGESYSGSPTSKTDPTLEEVTLMTDFHASVELQTEPLMNDIFDVLSRALHDPTLYLIEFHLKTCNLHEGFDFERARRSYENSKDKMRYAHAADLIEYLLSTPTPKVYYKMNVHGAVSIEEFHSFFEPIKLQAFKIYEAWKPQASCPKIVVFLDEINTTQYPGLMKEIIIDKSFHGEPLSPNLCVIGACNPHRAHSLVTHESKNATENWIKGTYYVNRLHPSLRCLIWQYGALSERQECKYIDGKMAKISKGKNRDERLKIKVLSEKIAESQRALRQFSKDHYMSLGYPPEISEDMSQCCVSQRDIQRAFTIYGKLIEMYSGFQQGSDLDVAHPCIKDDMPCLRRRALFVSLGVVYYFRLTSQHRKEYIKRYVEKEMHSEPSHLTFEKALQEEMDFYCDAIHLLHGVAKTESLKENLLCIILCCCTRLPLLIIGEPGCSKTFSFTLAANNLRGEDSPKQIFGDTSLFPNLWPHYYQCSRRTTSLEVENFFLRAIKRQQTTDSSVESLVFMDEAGLPEESMEALKILHKYLDNPQVSFVGISNHVLDAAKSNRAVILFRQDASGDTKTLRELATGCFGSANPPYMDHICTGYSRLLQRYPKFFGLRDFMHAFGYMRQRMSHLNEHHPKMHEEHIVVRAIERNFGGTQSLQDVVSCILPDSTTLSTGSVIDVLKESLSDHPHFSKCENQYVEEVRYKMVIDPSEDHSSRRLMLMFDLFEREKFNTFIIGGFPDDGDFQKIDIIGDITHVASSGGLAFMLQTDSIHESFYDVFNQHFRIVRGKDKPHFYATVASGSHSKPCRVDAEFQCVVFVQEKELARTPAPFLNRFEKYRLSTDVFLEAALHFLPQKVANAILHARKKVMDLVSDVGPTSFCGFNTSTIDSIFLEILPKKDMTVKRDVIAKKLSPSNYTRQDVIIFIIECLLHLNFQLEKGNNQAQTYCHIIELIIEEEGDFTFSVEDVSLLQLEVESQLYDENDSSSIVTKLISILVFVIVTQKLLQILIPEALIASRTRNTLPEWCSDLYFKHQDMYSTSIFLTNMESHRLCSKLVCFTSNFDASPEADDNFMARNNCVVCRLAQISTQEELEQKLKRFILSTHGSFLLIADMHTTSKTMINFARVKIDELDESLECKTNKVFLILLYFPPAVSQKSCYPASFLHGWNFSYTDSFQMESVTTMQWITLRDLFLYAYKADVERSKSTQQALTKACHDILQKDSARSITERVPFGSFTPEGQFRMNLLENMFLHTEIQKKLIDMFVNIWTPEVVSNYLQGAATYSRGCKAMISVTAQVFHQFENMLQRFVAYMVYRIHLEFNLHTYDEDTKELFVILIDSLPRPQNLHEVESYTTLRASHVSVKFTSFPNFENVCSFIDGSLKNSITAEITDLQSSFPCIAEKWMKECEECAYQSLFKVVKAMSDHNQLWCKYIEDFSHCKLMFLAENNVTILEKFTEDIGAKHVPEKLVILHSLLHLSPVSMQDFWSIIGYLETKVLISNACLKPEIILTCLMKDKHNVAKHVAELLYEGLKACYLQQEALCDWYNACCQLYCSADMFHLVLKSTYRYLPVWISIFLFMQSINLQQLDGMYSTISALCEHLITITEAAATPLSMREVVLIVQQRKIDRAVCTSFFNHLFMYYFNSSLFEWENKEHQQWFIKFLDAKPFLENPSSHPTAQYGYLLVHMLRWCESDERFVHNVGTLLQHENALMANFQPSYSPPFYTTHGRETSLLADMYFLVRLQHLRQEYGIGQKHQIIAHLLTRISSSVKSPIDRIDREVFIQLLLQELVVLLSNETRALYIDNDMKVKVQDILKENPEHKHALLLLLESQHQHTQSPARARAEKNGFIIPHEESYGCQSSALNESYCFDWKKLELENALSSKEHHGNKAAGFILKLLNEVEELNKGLALLPHLLDVVGTLKKYLSHHYDRSSVMDMSLSTAIEDMLNMISDEEIKKQLQDHCRSWCVVEKYEAMYPTSVSTSAFPLRNIVAMSNTSSIVTQVKSIVSSYKNIINDARNLNLSTWMTGNQAACKLSEISSDTQLFRTSLDEKHLLLVLRQSLPVSGCTITSSHVAQMCCDVIATYIAGAPAIDIDVPISELLKLPCRCTVSRSSMLGEFEALCEDMDTEVFSSCEETKLEEGRHLDAITFHFHECDYHTCIVLARGLQRILRLICQHKGLDPTQTLCDFLASIGKKLSDDHRCTSELKDYFPHLPRSLSSSLWALGKMPIASVRHTLRIFSEWIDNGFYVFRTLPQGVKRPLPVECVSQLKRMSQETSKIQAFIDLEDNIQVEVMGFAFGDIETGTLDQTLRKYVVDYQILAQDSAILEHIPDQIMVHHYVSFVIFLRSITKEERLKGNITKLELPDVVKMTENEVASLLKKIGLSTYCSVFRQNHVSGALLIELEELDLPLLDINDPTHQRILLDFLSRVKGKNHVPVWRSRKAPDSHRSMKKKELCKWLKKIGMSEYQEMFKQAKVTGMYLSGIQEYTELAAKEKGKTIKSSVESDLESSGSEDDEPELNITNSLHAKWLLVKFYEQQEVDC